MMRALVLVAMLMMSWFAQAEPLRYVGVPVFYSKYLPKVAPCTYDDKSRYGFCGWANYPEEGEVGVTTQSGDVTEAFFVRLYDEVVCIGQICQTNYGQARGYTDEPLDTVSYWYVPKGFYLAPIAGVITAVKFGNGPRALSYPIRGVKILPEYDDRPDGEYIPEEKESDVYNVYCNPALDCEYMGRVFTFEQLRKYIPAIMTTDCGKLFCHNKEGDVVGINPKEKT